MKKLILMLMLCAPMTMMAQKFGKVNTQQIMQSLPDVAKANGEMEALQKQKEKEASDLKKKYFGAEGDLYKMREALMGPIQEEIYTAVKEISDLRGYSLVLDRASNSGIIFGSPKIDISNEVLQKLGYSK